MDDPTGDWTTCLTREQANLCTVCALHGHYVDAPPAVWLVAGDDYPYPADWVGGSFEYVVGEMLWEAAAGEGEFVWKDETNEWLERRQELDESREVTERWRRRLEEGREPAMVEWRGDGTKPDGWEDEHEHEGHISLDV